MEKSFLGGVVAGVESLGSVGSFVGSGAGGGLEMLFPPGDISEGGSFGPRGCSGGFDRETTVGCLRSKVDGGEASTEASGPGETEGGLRMVSPLGGEGSERDGVRPGGGRRTSCGGYPKSTVKYRQLR